jgi:dimeric dUTPase (all-alpha-NTP-PPase superfamily)
MKRIKMDLKKEQLKNKIALELKVLIEEVYNKPKSTHYWLPVKYSETIVKIMEEHNENS